MSSKGRPPKLIIEDLPRKFIREINFKDGRSQKWHYDLDRNPNGNPIEVEMFYPEGFFEDETKTKKKKNGKKEKRS